MVLPMLVIGVIVFLIGMILNKHISANACVMMIFSYLYGGFLLYSMVILRNINIWILAIVFITVMLTDVGGYIFGYLFGKHKLCPTISPKKTIEGGVLGTIFGVCCGTGAYFVATRLIEEVVFSTFNEMHIALEILSVVGITLLLAVTGQLGDLVASKLKRAYDIKDFGKIFPGHGGVLDRFDSTLIAAALMFVICYMIGVI
jgi:phosphatidate cytidylyltransferase